MAASDFGTASQFFAMSTGAGTPSADVSNPWCPGAPSLSQQQQRRQELNHAFHHQTYGSILPPPQQQYHSSPYIYPRAHYPPYAAYEGRPPMAMYYPPSALSLSSHQPRLPPAIRSGRVDELLETPCPDVYRGGGANHGSFHTWSQGLPPSASGRCPLWMGPQSATMAEDTPNLPFDRRQAVQTMSGGDVEQSRQALPSHPRLLVSNQPPQPQQSQQRQADRSGVIRHNEHSESRVPRNLTTQVRRSDRSSSPRTSARRNFDRYSGDLTQSSTSSDAEEVAARSPPANRIRRGPRDGRPRFHSQTYDPNVILSRQIQELKISLDKYLLGQLPEVTSPTCDICAKDYSATSVQPSEEEEIAMMLPCGHVFGEFCIDQWFETCKTHKNKITCPMCRKQLIEPLPSPYTRGYFNTSSYMFTARNPRAVEDFMADELQAQYARMG